MGETGIRWSGNGLRWSRGVRFEFLAAGLSDGGILAGFCAPVRGWWMGKFSEMSGPQRMAVPAIGAGKNTLVCAPTGSGKTLCAFISILSELFGRHLAGEDLGSAGVDTVYVSPLKALGTDVTKNLMGPLAEIAAGMGLAESPILGGAADGGYSGAGKAADDGAAAAYSGDDAGEPGVVFGVRRGMREHFRGVVRRIIVDELHSVAGNKAAGWI